MGSKVKVTEDIFQRCIFQFDLDVLLVVLQFLTKRGVEVKGQDYDQIKRSERAAASTTGTRRVLCSFSFNVFELLTVLSFCCCLL